MTDQFTNLKRDPTIGDKVTVHYDDGSSVAGVLVAPKPCWQFLQAESGNVYIIDNKAICIEKVEEQEASDDY